MDYGTLNIAPGATVIGLGSFRQALVGVAAEIAKYIAPNLKP